MGDDDSVKKCKIVLLGESGVGKTCIIARFINNTFEDNIMSTKDALYAEKIMTFDEYIKVKVLNFKYGIQLEKRNIVH